MRTLSTWVGVLGLISMAVAPQGHAQLPPVPTAQAAAKTPALPKATGDVPAGAGCLIAEFRTIGLSVHNPADRHERAWNWLRANAQRCSLAQLQTVNNNRAGWLGSSDTPEIMGFVEAIIEYRTLGHEDGLKALYNSKPLEVGPAMVTTGLPERPTPVVPLGASAMPSGIYIPPPMASSESLDRQGPMANRAPAVGNPPQAPPGGR